MGNTGFGSANNSLRNSDLQLQTQDQYKIQNPAVFRRTGQIAPFSDSLARVRIHVGYAAESLLQAACWMTTRFRPGLQTYARSESKRPTRRRGEFV